MKFVLFALMVIAVSAMAMERTGGSGAGNPWSCKGSYTVEGFYSPGFVTSYGLAIKDNVSNSIWILNWGDMLNNELDMSTGGVTGTTWAITGGVDPDDQSYCEYTTGNQWFLTDYAIPMFGVFEEDGTWIRNVSGPASYTNLFGIGAGHDMMYVGSPNEDVLAWGPYTGTETSIAWSGEMVYESIYGLAVYGDYLFVSCGGETGIDNLFIHSIATDGTPSAAPVWSCYFDMEAAANGGIDYDGEFLWLYPQNSNLYKLGIDFTGLESGTWADIKASF